MVFDVCPADPSSAVWMVIVVLWLLWVQIQAGRLGCRTAASPLCDRTDYVPYISEVLTGQLALTTIWLQYFSPQTAGFGEEI
jgi:hypothetical protein